MTTAAPRKSLAPGAKYTKKEVMDLFAYFQRLDKDRSGGVSGSELINAPPSLKMLPPGMDDRSFMRAFDKNQDGVLS